jgi:hypothetical protein
MRKWVRDFKIECFIELRWKFTQGLKIPNKLFRDLENNLFT